MSTTGIPPESPGSHDRSVRPDWRERRQAPSQGSIQLPGNEILTPPLTPDEALAQGTVQVTEVSKGGHVPELRLINRGDRPVLLIDGEELIGAKQNRVLNLTILAAPYSELVIPVSCVEQGRWSAVSPEFCASPRVHFAASRAAKVASVSDCLAEGQGAVSDQSEVWHHIAAKAARFPPTGFAWRFAHGA